MGNTLSPICKDVRKTIRRGHLDMPYQLVSSHHRQSFMAACPIVAIHICPPQSKLLSLCKTNTQRLTLAVFHIYPFLLQPPHRFIHRLFL